jgi:transcriptional regulator with XRE-family HTH domain
MSSQSEIEEQWEFDAGLASRVLDQMGRLTQSELARRTKIPESTLSRYLHPQPATQRYRGTPAYAVRAIAAVLNVTVCQLYGVEEQHAKTIDPSLSHAERQALDNIARELVKLRDVRPRRPSRPVEPTQADRDTRDLLAMWETLTPAQREEWLAAAEEIRRLDQSQ